MSEMFSGVRSFFGIRSSDERQLDRMIDQYARGGTEGHRDTAEGLRLAMQTSPDLKERTLEVMRAGNLTQYSSDAVVGAGSASYQVHDSSIKVAPGFAKHDRAFMEMVFMLGHETEHGRSLQGRNYITETLAPAIQQKAIEPNGPRDYTDIVNAYAERTRAEEGRAHLGGFNALSSAITHVEKVPQDKLLQTLYEAHPERMGDFIQKSASGQYALKPGLEMDDRGRLPYSQDNIEAMKGYYADKAQLGAPHMNYRQDSINEAVKIITHLETTLAERNFEDRSYIIDPTRLQAHPALGLPADGRHTAQGLPQAQSLESLLGNLNPNAAQPAPSQAVAQVSLQPTAQDHPLMAQALNHLAPLHAEHNLGSPQDVRNLAAFAAVEAQKQQLPAINAIEMSKDGGGIILTHGSRESGTNVRVDGMTGMQTPEAESVGKLAPMQAQAASQSASQPQVLAAQEHATQGHGVHEIAPRKLS